jgi:cytochrome c551/c552
MLKRVLIVLVGVLCGLMLLLWAGSHYWISQQSPRLRASLGAFSTSELLQVVSDQFFPEPLKDNATFGRRTRLGRGHSPWVLRTSLDGRPRILSLAIGDKIWLAYSTETGSIHRLWQGELKLAGPVYDGIHGAEPASRGMAWWMPPTQTAWRVREGKEWRPARIRWRGHAFAPEQAGVQLQFDLVDTTGAVRTVVERPELGRDENGLYLQRRFVLSEEGPPVALVAGAAGTDATLENARKDPKGRIVFTASAATITTPLGKPLLAIDSTQTLFAAEPFVEHGCTSCHREQERIVGPSWTEIALRNLGDEREATARRLGERIREGGQGVWGEVPMPAHAHIPPDEAAQLAREILAMAPSVAEPPPGEESGGQWTFGFPTEPRPTTLHPSLEANHLGPPDFTPQTGGLAILPDGRLAVATWDPDGAVYAIRGWRDQGRAAQVERIAEGLHEPLGLAVVEGALFVMQKQELTQLIDLDGDGKIDEYRTLSADFGATSNFHEFAFGLAAIDGWLHAGISSCVRPGGDSCLEQHADRGRIFRVNIETGELEFVARGFRTPDGIAAAPDGSLLVTDNQGSWLPASKLVRVRPGSFHGWRAPRDQQDHGPTIPPALWLPQNEVGNSPTQPMVLRDGPYAGHILFGDIFNGGLKRGFLETVEGVEQGAAFHFSGGLEAPVHRLIAADDGAIIAGEVGSRGNWGEPGKLGYGLELLRFGDEPAFEALEVRATAAGFDIVFTRPLAAEITPLPEYFRLQQWSYRPNEYYGGPKFDLSPLPVHGVSLSDDRYRVSLRVGGRKPGSVVYIHIDRALRSELGETLWVNEAWYTLNEIPASPSEFTHDAAQNTLTDEEREAGWRLLWDGRSFKGWKIYGREDNRIDGWVIEDEALKFTRDVSFAGMVWNHINPFTEGALELLTEKKFRNFELRIDWKVTPGANSGIFYAVPNEETFPAWSYGLEMQVLDDAGHSDGQIDKRRAGDLYDLQGGRVRAARPVGEWNEARIRVFGEKIEHWLNGEKIVSITRGSKKWNAAIAASKFADSENFGRALEGHIALQDHGDIVYYRNLKIRELDTPEAEGAPGKLRTTDRK